MTRQYIPQTFGTDARFWVGVVEDRNDPLQVGRTRVRIHGYHTDDKTLIPTDCLPWAVPLNSVNSAGVSGVGQSPTGLMIGSVVFGTWLDGNDCQQPLVMGTLNALEGGRAGGLLDPTTNLINDSTVGSTSGGGGTTSTSGSTSSATPVVPGYFQPKGDGPQWLQVARGEIGQKERVGTAFNPRILDYLRSCHISDTKAAWCSAFVKWCVDKGGGDSSGANGFAKSWLKVGTPLTEPRLGCVCVFNRPPNPALGHAGFFLGTEGGRIKIIGGNQDDAVNVTTMSQARLAGYRWPGGSGGGATTSV